MLLTLAGIGNDCKIIINNNVVKDNIACTGTQTNLNFMSILVGEWSNEDVKLYNSDNEELGILGKLECIKNGAQTSIDNQDNDCDGIFDEMSTYGPWSGIGGDSCNSCPNGYKFLYQYVDGSYIKICNTYNAIVPNNYCESYSKSQNTTTYHSWSMLQTNVYY